MFPRKDNPAHDGGFTLVEVVMVAAVTLLVLAGFVALFRTGQGALGSAPETAALRLDASAMLDLVARDLERAGSGLPPEIPVFNDLGRAGNRNPDGLDFLASPARLAETGFEPVVSFDGTTTRLGIPASRLAASSDDLVVVFNDDEMMPRWALGEVSSVSASGSGGILTDLKSLVPEAPGGSSSGARVRIQPVRNDWHYHFRSLDADTFSPGGGGGLMQRGLKSLLGGVIEAALPNLGAGPMAALTDQVFAAMVEKLAGQAGQKGKSGKSGKLGKLPGIGGGEEEGYGLFGLGQPGIVPVSRIRYWLRDPRPGRDDGRRTLMRQVNDRAPQPVGFAEDLQIRYITGRDADGIREAPPSFLGDMKTAATLADWVVRGVDIEIRVMSSGAANRQGSSGGVEAAHRTVTARRRVGIRVASAGAARRAWEESMQRNSLPTEIPRIGPLRFIKLPW